jgi:hypothetical protein
MIHVALCSSFPSGLFAGETEQNILTCKSWQHRRFSEFPTLLKKSQDHESIKIQGYSK